MHVFQVPLLKKSWLVSLSTHPSFYGFTVTTLISAMLYSGQNDLVEVRLRQLSYHIDPTLVSSGPSSALLAPDCTKNAGIISFFEPPSATTLTKGLLLILDNLFTSPCSCPLIQTPTGPSPPSHLPLTFTLQTQTWAPQAELGWTLWSRLETTVSFPKLCQVKDSGSALMDRGAVLPSHLHSTFKGYPRQPV